MGLNVSNRERPIWGLMPMSDVPMSAWSNWPISMFKTGFQPVITQRTHMKNAEKMQHMQGWNRFYPYPFVAFFSIFRVRVLLISIFFSIANSVCAEYDRLETGLYTTALPDQYCWLVQCKLSIWTRFGRSSRLLGIVTRPILAVSCSNQYLMQVSLKRRARYRRFYIVPCQRSPFQVCCHEIWNRTQCIAVVVTSERLGHWIVT